MTSRRTLSLLALTLAAFCCALVPGAPAWAASADSSAASPAPDPGAADPGTAAPSSADSSAAPEAKVEEKKDEEKKAEAKESAKKTKKSKAKAATGGKGAAKVDAAAKPETMPVKPAVEPQHVQVQHILIGFAGSVPGKPITRSKDEAKTLAYQVLDRARKGESFDELVKKYTDDSPPGIYGMSGNGVPPATGEYPRNGMVPAFGNVGFAISPGNIGIADFDAKASPFGWHIIKRLK